MTAPVRVVIELAITVGTSAGTLLLLGFRPWVQRQATRQERNQ